AELGTVWERTEPWGLGLADFYWWNGRLLKAFLGRESDVKALTEGKKAGAGGHSVMPILVWWDESGKRSVEPLLPADVKRSRDDRDHHWPDFSSLGRYGAYVDWSHDKS